MKVSVGNYAKTLYEMTKDKDSAGVDKVIRGFVDVLQKNGQLRLKGEIIEKFEKIYNEKNGIVKSEIVSKSEIKESLDDGINKFLESRNEGKSVTVEKKKDDEMKGGVIIKSGDEMLDGSIDSNLRRLKADLLS